MTPTMTATRPNTASDAELMRLETAFWDAIKTRNGREVARLTSDDCTIVGASGASPIDPITIAKMVESAPYTIRDYRIDPKTTRIVRLDDATVLVAYRVHEDVEVDGRLATFDAFDSSIWRHDDDEWTCVLHTESIAGDAFGRDRHPS